MKRIHSIVFVLCTLSMLWPRISLSQQDSSGTGSGTTFSIPHFRIIYEPGIPIENIRGIADDIEVIYGDFNAKVMLRLPKEIPTVICPSYGGLVRRMLLRPGSPVVYLRDTLFLVSWKDAGIAREQMLPMLRYAVAFAVLDRGANHGTPWWLKNGYALRNSHPEISSPPPPIAYMRSFDDFGEEDEQSAVSGGSSDYQYLLLKTIDYLINRYGEPKFVSLFTVLQSDRSLEEGFEKAFGEKYTAIEKEWRAYIDTQVGKSVKQKGKESNQREK
jgi:hypothetical protein